MASYSILWKRSALQDLRALPREIVKPCLKMIESLKSHPFPRGFKKIQGAEKTYRLRLGRYRIVYQTEKARHTVVIYHIRHRKDVYRALPPTE